MQTLVVNVNNQTDLQFLVQVINRLGFEPMVVKSKSLSRKKLEHLIDDYIASAPVNIDISDEEIINEIKQVRNQSKA